LICIFLDQQLSPTGFASIITDIYSELGTFRVFFRVQWQPFDDRFGEMKSRFYHHLSILHTSSHANLLENSTRQGELLEKEFSKAELERVRVQTNEELDERRRFLEWISKDDHEMDFDRLIKQRHPGTGTWLLEDKKFREWEEQSTSSLLWCYGHRMYMSLSYDPVLT
jgi:hypothetical protein